MPYTTFDPNSGVRDQQTEQEAQAERMREFLFRQQLLNRSQGQEAPRMAPRGNDMTRLTPMNIGQPSAGGQDRDSDFDKSPAGEMEPHAGEGAPVQQSAADRVREKILRDAGMLPDNPVDRRGGMMSGTFGKDGKQYQPDQKSVSDLENMANQLRGQVSPAAAASLDSQLGSVKRAADYRMANPPQAAATATATGVDKSLLNDVVRNTLGMKPDQAAIDAAKIDKLHSLAVSDRAAAQLREDTMAGKSDRKAVLTLMAQSQDPATRAIGMQGLAKLAAVDVPADFGAPSQRERQAISLDNMASQGQSLDAFKQTPSYQVARNKITMAAKDGSQQAGVAAKMAIDAAVSEAAALGVPEEAVRQGLMSELDLQQPMEKGLFAGAPWRDSTQFRNSAGLPQPGLFTWQP